MLERPRTDALATLKGLTLRLDGCTPVDDISLTLRRGGCTAVMGPNGAGKSVLLKLLHGLVDPTAGRIIWSGDRPRQAMLFQTPVLLRRTVAANVDFALRVRGIRNPARRDALLAQTGLAGRGAAPARRLSGGEQQRLALARALAMDPKVIFMDEPTASLDPAATHRIEGMIADLVATGTTVVLVTHDIGQARRLADDVVFLHGGKLIEHSPAALFFNDPATAPARRYLAGGILI